jgi:hypothetical protein
MGCCRESPFNLSKEVFRQTIDRYCHLDFFVPVVPAVVMAAHHNGSLR